MELTPIQMAALVFVANNHADLRKISEPMRQRIIDLGMMEPPLVDVNADHVYATEAGHAELAKLHP